MVSTNIYVYDLDLYLRPPIYSLCFNSIISISPNTIIEEEIRCNLLDSYLASNRYHNIVSYIIY